jgi:hypothetical protein
MDHRAGSRRGKAVKRPCHLIFEITFVAALGVEPLNTAPRPIRFPTPHGRVLPNST